MTVAHPHTFGEDCVPEKAGIQAGAHRTTSDGQALTEFLVLALALVSLFLLIPVIAKYQDVAFEVQMASRYVAFEAMTRNEAYSTYKSPEQLAGEVRRRFFSNADAPVITGDTAGNFLAHQNLFWRQPDGKPLIANVDTDVAVSFGPNQASVHGAAFSPASDGSPFNGIERKLGLNANGIYTGNVTVKLANLPTGLKAYAPFNNINLSVTRRTSIVVDGWQAKDPDQVVRRIDTAWLVPGTALRGAAPVVNAAVTVVEGGQLNGPKLGELDFWRDVVPPDRLK